MWVQSLGWEDPLEKGKATHSSILAWRIPQRRLVGYTWGPWGHKESDITEQLSSHTGGSAVKNLPANAGDVGLIPGSGRSPGGENDKPLYYCLGNSMDRVAWWATAHEIAKESDMT